jgi:hypothetical protein
MHTSVVTFLDPSGQPFPARVQQVLTRCMPELRRQFAALADDCVLTELLEDVGRRVMQMEARYGGLKNLEAYAWTVAQRRARRRFAHDIPCEPDLLDHLPAMAAAGSAQQLEDQIFLGEVYRCLTPREQEVVLAYQAGAVLSELSAASGERVEHIWRVAKRKLRNFVSVRPQQIPSAR